jgi:uncharacterized damage-inducible protein DinB
MTSQSTPTDPATIQYLWRYMAAADGEMLVAARSLEKSGVPADAFTREQNISLGSIHKLLAHAVAAQRVWLERLTGQDPRRMISPEELPTLDAIAAYWPPLHAELLEFADRQTPASLATILHGHNTKGVPFSLPVGVVMLHVSDHATYHRGQLNSMIKLVGGAPSTAMLYTYGLSRMAAAK